MGDLDLVKQAWQAHNWIALGMAVVMLLVRQYRKDGVQNFLPAGLKWDALPTWVNRAIVLVIAAFGSIVPSLLGGMSWYTALGSAVVVAIGAMFGHDATKAVGSALTAAAIKKDPEYMPGPVRKSLSVVVPIDQMQLRERQWGPVVAKAFSDKGLPPEWGLAIVRQESGFNPDAEVKTGGDGVRGGAYGLGQMTFKTAREELGFRGEPVDLLNPLTNANLTAAYVAMLRSRWGSELLDVYAAYNSGKNYLNAPAVTKATAVKVVRYAKDYQEHPIALAA